MTIGREPIALAGSATEVLLRLRGFPRLVALIGSGWRCGDALVACDPIRELVSWDDIDLPSCADDAFGGGWIGSWGYQLGAEIESLPPAPLRPVEQPSLRVGFYDVVLRRLHGQWWLEWLEGADPARIDRLRRAMLTPQAPRPFRAGDFTMTPGPEVHVAAVTRAIERIEAGDIFQANVCTRLEASFEGDPLDAFCRGIEELAPAFAAYVADEHGAIASWSPELFLRRHGTEVLTSPIKGTAALTTDPQLLLSSAKDRAENVMIVDLMRNDLGRVAEPGTVNVPALNRLERHAVWHLVSDVAASTRAPDSALLRATFPPGSVTGAPKIRAMELINTELEATAREAYTGAIGYVSPAAGMELNVAIRTFEFAAGRVWLGVGGGIVADSDPQTELAECFVKARPLVAALSSRIADEVPCRRPEHRAAPEPTEPADPTAGVFTTLLVQNGRPVDLDAHLDRLARSAHRLYALSLPADARERVQQQAAALTGRHRLRLDLSCSGLLTLLASPLAPEPLPWRLSPFCLPGGWGEHKWVDRGAVPQHGDEPLIVDRNQQVLETARASVFAVFDDGLHTPPLDGRILPGTMRARIIARARQRGIPVHERSFTLQELSAASEVFATNALRGIVPVAEAAGVGRWPTPGPLTASLSRSAPKVPTFSRLPGPLRVLVVDNRDSFVFNLVQYARELGADVEVVRCDTTAAEVAGFTHVVISPGPGGPADARTSAEVVRAAAAAGLPVLGVCLGHQVIAEVFGGIVERATPAVHGKPALVHHDGRGVFAGLPQPLTAGRYHSLAVSSVPEAFQISARTGSGIVLGLRHHRLPIDGVQFHPESILTQHGHLLLSNFLRQRPVAGHAD